MLGRIFNSDIEYWLWCSLVLLSPPRKTPEKASDEATTFSFVEILSSSSHSSFNSHPAFPVHHIHHLPAIPVHHIHHLPAIPPFDDTVLSETDNGEKQTITNIGVLKVGEAVAKFKTTNLVNTVTLKSANDS